jgi:hypothetical protein
MSELLGLTQYKSEGLIIEGYECRKQLLQQ